MALGLSRLRKEVADFAEDLDVGCRVRPKALPDGRLIDQDQVVYAFEALDGVKGPLLKLRIAIAFCAVIEGLVDEGGLPCAGDAGDADHDSERDPDIDSLQVMLAGISDQDPPPGFQGRAPA